MRAAGDKILTVLGYGLGAVAIVSLGAVIVSLSYAACRWLVG